MRARNILLAIAAGLALADASIVTLALPELLFQLDTTVEGVAAVIGVYTIVLAACLIPAERLMRSMGPQMVAAGGLAIFALACLLCGLAESLPVLLLGRAIQAVGGAAALVAVFGLLVDREGGHASARELWLGAAVLSAAIGPALGGALTEAFAWEAIFLFQAPVAAVAAVVASRAPWTPKVTALDAADVPFAPRPAIGLALVSAALTAVLFLLVLLLVAGWAVDPLLAALTVSVVPVGALIGYKLTGDAVVRAGAGCALVGLGTCGLAFLPDANVAWTILPQALAGLGMGLALPALGGELLPERNSFDAARLLTVRHVGIAVALLVLAPVTAQRLDSAREQAIEEGVGQVLDSQMNPTVKLEVAPAFLDGVNSVSPRGGLEDAITEKRVDVDAADRPAYDKLGADVDDTLVAAIRDSFFPAFLITGLFALIAAAVLLIRRPGGAALPMWGIGTITAGVIVLVVQVVAFQTVPPARASVKDPCKPRNTPEVAGTLGTLQKNLLKVADAVACKQGSSREELVLALLSTSEARKYKRDHGFDVSPLSKALEALLPG